MSIYKGLWKKEMMMMRGFHVFMLLVFIAVTGITIYQRGLALLDEVTLMGLSMMGMILLPATLLFSLNMEVHQMSIFLFLKKQISKQIHIKFLHGVFLTGLYLLVMVVMSIILKLFEMTNYSFIQLFKLLMTAFLFNLFIAILITVSVYGAWVMHQWMKENIGFVFSMFALFLVFFLVIKSFEWILSILSFLADWWLIEIQAIADIPLTIFIVDNQLSLSLVIAFGLVLYGFYRFFTWVLVKRVEV
ncbi:hypothetical protein [Gracilibacillus lacisalsi]|uniref:hypothetical protein n=1 Tax=Gracilibacillus lacisalsi TaxID=393087 RepID=UPI00037E57DA|nr:hypothetical protein [Gracilibacillus lacisalsi]